MAKITVDIQDKLLDEATKKEIKTLRSKVSRLESKVTKLQYKIDSQLNKVARAKKIIEAVREAGDFEENDEGFDWAQ